MWFCLSKLGIKIFEMISSHLISSICEMCCCALLAFPTMCISLEVWFKSVASVLWVVPYWYCRYTWLQVALGTRSVCAWPSCWACQLLPPTQDEVRGLVRPFRQVSLSASNSFCCVQHHEIQPSPEEQSSLALLFFEFCMLAWLRIPEEFF